MAGTSSISGIISGLNTSDIISKLMEIEKEPMTKVKALQTAENKKLEVWQTISTKLLKIRTQSLTLSRAYSFQTTAATSSKPETLSILSTTDAKTVTQSITVDQLAQSEQVLSRGVASTTAALMGAGTLKIKLGQGGVNGNNVTAATDLAFLNSGAGVDTAHGISLTNRAGSTTFVSFAGASTVQDIIDDINSASSRNGLAISASLNKDGNGLLLTDASGGTLNSLQVAEWGGTAARDLGILGSAASGQNTLTGVDLDPTYSIDIDSTNNTLEGIQDTINDLNAPFSASIMNTGDAANPYKLVINSKYSGVIGNLTITETSSKITDEAVGTGDGTKGHLLGDYALAYAPVNGLGNIESITVGGAAYAVAEAGHRTGSGAEVEVDLATGKLQFFNEGAAVDVTGDIKATYTPADLDLDLAQGLGKVTQNAQDAILKIGVDNPQVITRHTNTIGDLIQGVTMQLNQKSATPVTVSVTSDVTQVKKTISDLLDAYNETIDLINEQFKYDVDAKTTGGPLFGDQTLMLIQNQLQQTMMADVQGLPSNMRSIFQIGISADLSGHLTVNDTELTNALTNHLDDVIKLFTQSTNVVSSSSATAESSTGTETGYAAESVVNATNTSESFGAGTGGWMSGTAVSATVPAYLTVKLNAAHALSKVVIQTLDSLAQPSGNWGISSMVVQYLKLGGNAALDADWATASSVANNQAGTITSYLPSKSTEQVRLKITGSNAADGRARVVSVQAYENTGLAGRLNNILSSITDAYSGSIFFAQQEINDQIESYQDRIDQMQQNLNDKQAKLENDFNKMESYLSQMKQQSTALQNAINGLTGNTSSSSSSSSSSS